MKQVLLSLIVCTSLQATAQTNNNSNTKRVKGQANDHFMIQLAADNWSGKPDSVRTKGIGRGANVYFMINFPFKTNRYLSAAIGAGIGTSSIYFDEQNVLIGGTSNQLQFNKVDTTNNFKKYKLTTAYLEVPVELRYTSDPDHRNKSWKFAIGGKVGTLLSSYTKGKTLEDKNDRTINEITEKTKRKSYFNSSRIALTARVGWGNYSLFGQYQVTNPFKDGVAPDVRPYSIGIAVSGF